MSDRDVGLDLTVADYARLTSGRVEKFGPENYDEKEGRPANLEGRIITPPPDNPPPGVMGDVPRQSTIRQGLGRGGFAEAPSWQELPQFLGILHKINDNLVKALSRGQFLPELHTLGWITQASGWGTAAIPNMIVPPQAGNAIYVCGLWWSSTSSLAGVAFGQGTSLADAEFFPTALGLNPALPVAANGGFSMTAGRPNWVFRVDPGKGLLINLSAGGNAVSGYVSYFLADLQKELPADLS